MIRLLGVLNITKKKIAQEEGRVLEPVLRKEASVTTSLRLPGVPNIISRNRTGRGVALETLCWERRPL